MDDNRQKRREIDIKTKVDQNGPKWTKVDKGRLKWTIQKWKCGLKVNQKWTKNEPKWTKVD